MWTILVFLLWVHEYQKRKRIEQVCAGYRELAVVNSVQRSYYFNKLIEKELE